MVGELPVDSQLRVDSCAHGLGVGVIGSGDEVGPVHVGRTVGVDVSGPGTGGGVGEQQPFGGR